VARLKREKVYRRKAIGVRMTDEDYNLIKLAANIYADGNVSEYMRYAAINFEPEYCDLEDPEIDELIKSVQNKHLGRPRRA